MTIRKKWLRVFVLAGLLGNGVLWASIVGKARIETRAREAMDGALAAEAGKRVDLQAWRLCGQ